MTLVVAVTGRKTIWLLADRRLSYAGRSPNDHGRKIMLLDTTDGVAILGYAGLGATVLGTEPADWMSAVLRGRSLPLEQSLNELAKAMQKQLPPHLDLMPAYAKAHFVIVPAFLGKEPRMYSIIVEPGQKSYRVKYSRYVGKGASNLPTKTPVLKITGSGAGYLMKNKKWMLRRLRRVARDNDRGTLPSARLVADYLAKLNHEAHLGDKSVGPRCIVAYRFRGSGGAQQFYTGTQHDHNSPLLPHILTGTDLSGVLGVLMSDWQSRSAAMLAGEPIQPMDKDEIEAALSRLPDKPDEDLR